MFFYCFVHGRVYASRGSLLHDTLHGHRAQNSALKSRTLAPQPPKLPQQTIKGIALLLYCLYRVAIVFVLLFIFTFFFQNINDFVWHTIFYRLYHNCHRDKKYSHNTNHDRCWSVVCWQRRSYELYAQFATRRRLPNFPKCSTAWLCAVYVTLCSNHNDLETRLRLVYICRFQWV